MPVEQLAYIKGLLDEWGRVTRGERDKPREGLAPREIPVAVNHESASRARIPKVDDYPLGEIGRDPVRVFHRAGPVLKLKGERRRHHDRHGLSV